MKVVILLAIISTCTLAASPFVLFSDALEQAIINVDRINALAMETIIGDHNPATAASVASQRIGDIIQEISRILVLQNGSAILSEFEGIDIVAIVQSQLDSEQRRKRNAGSSDGIIHGSDIDPCFEAEETCDRNFPFRSNSGRCNHDDNPAWGSAQSPLRRFMGAAKYDDGFNSVRQKAANGGVLPSARVVSNNIFNEAANLTFDPKYNHLLMQFGQWIAHDITYTPQAVGNNELMLNCSLCESANITSNCAPIEVPDGDAYFPSKTPDGKRACIRLARAINGQTKLGPRVQINQATHFLDLSQVYGSQDCIAKKLRTLKDGQMIMYTGKGYSLPPRVAKDTNCKSQSMLHPPSLCFDAGDDRNSLQPGLIPLHTIYLRQHNKWAAQISKKRPSWSDQLVFQKTRRLMIAVYQHHVYTEYLPKIIGNTLMKEFDLNPSGLQNTYDAAVDPSISAEFASAAFRFGHSQARKDIPRTTHNNDSIGSYLNLGDNIYYTDSLYDKAADVFSMAQGMVNAPAMPVGHHYTFPMRHEIFSVRGKKATGVDLPAVNVQRAREMGVQGYNEIRSRIPGLSRVSFFEALETELDQDDIDMLKKTYDSVDDIDLYAGILMERPNDPTALASSAYFTPIDDAHLMIRLRKLQLGPTGSYLIAEQFSALKKGDRYFYENTDNYGRLTPEEYEAITNYSLAQLICENTNGMELVQTEIFEFNAARTKCSEFKPFPLADILF